MFVGGFLCKEKKQDDGIDGLKIKDGDGGTIDGFLGYIFTFGDCDVDFSDLFPQLLPPAIWDLPIIGR